MRFALHLLIFFLLRANSHASGSQPRGRVEKHWGRGGVRAQTGPSRQRHETTNKSLK